MWSVEYLVRYFKGMTDIGVNFTPSANNSFECYADTEYCSIWYKALTKTDTST